MISNKIDELYFLLLGTISFLIFTYLLSYFLLINDNLPFRIRYYIFDSRFYFLDIPLLFSLVLSLFLLFKNIKFLFILLLIISAYILIYLTFGKFSPY